MHIHGRTITEAVHKAVRAQLDDEKPDAVLNIESHFFNFCLTSDSCEYDLDVGKELWLNKQRWSRLMKEYVAKDHLERFVSQIREILAGDARKGATANMMFRDVDRYDKKHRWGSCLMGATFRGDYDSDPTITFYSRTSYLGYMGLLDVAIANRIIDEAGDPKLVKFRWNVTSSQLHCFKTLPLIFSQPDLLKKMKDQIKQGKFISPTWKHICNWYCKILQAYKTHGNEMLLHEKYGPFKRIKRRWLEHMGYSTKNVPPSLHVNALDFSKCI